MFNIIKDFFLKRKLEKKIPNITTKLKPRFSSFNNVDTKIYFNEKLNNCMCFSYIQTKNNISGSLIMLVVEDGKEELWLGRKLQLKVIAIDEFGGKATIFNNRVEITSISCGVSVDDLVIEKTI